MTRRPAPLLAICEHVSIPLLSLFFATAVAGGGIPVLRHDWGWPRDRTAAFWAWWSVAGPWTAVGLGGANGNPNHVFANALCVLMQLLLGPHLALWVVSFLTALYGAYSARRLTLYRRRDPVLGVGAAGFVLFAPWTYTEIVAGHLYTIAAGFAILAVVAELRREAPRTQVLIWSSVIALAQLQLFLVVATLIGCYACLRRSWFSLAAVALIASGPIAALLIHRGSLAATPFTLTWERDQSLLPLASLATDGYFARYTRDWPILSANAALLVALGAAAGAIVGRDRRVAILAAAATTAIVVAVSAPLGPLAGTYNYLAERFAIVAVFRELYTPVVLLYATYLIGFSALSARFRIASWLLLASFLALVSGWIAAPPSRQWFTAEALPKTAIPTNNGRRFALIPGLQPLSYHSRSGSGLDPDAYPRGADQLPLNVPDLRYPETEAFERFERLHDSRSLGNLGAGIIVRRPYLATEIGALRPQGTNVATDAPVRSQVTVVNARPFAAIAPLPSISVTGDSLEEDAVLFGDARIANGRGVPEWWHRQPRGIAVLPPRRYVDPSRDWIDARLAFITYPWTSQAFGGAFTLSRGARLQVDSGARAALVKIDGSLMSGEKRVLARGNGSQFVWIRLSATTTSLQCRGRCLVATFADGIPPTSRTGPVVETATAASVLAPWFIVAHVGASPRPRVLRLLARADKAWAGYLNGSKLALIRIDGVFAGWIVPERMSGTAVLIDGAVWVVLPLETLALTVLTLSLFRCLWKARLAKRSEKTSSW